jgi:hypothetical protein
VADPAEIRDGEIVLVHRVELYYALVQRDVAVRPLNPTIGDRRARVEEIKRVFRDVGAPGTGRTRLLPSPRQLRRDGLGEGGGSP